MANTGAWYQVALSYRDACGGKQRLESDPGEEREDLVTVDESFDF